MNILIIEDDEQACIELQTCIEEKKDLRLCACTNNATDALHLTQEFLPEVVILDLELNLNGAGGNGLEYLAALQKIQFRHRPCIVVTTNNTSQIILSTARKYGADIILTKYQHGYSAEYVIKTICLMQDSHANDLHNELLSLSSHRQSSLQELSGSITGDFCSDHMMINAVLSYLQRKASAQQATLTFTMDANFFDYIMPYLDEEQIAHLLADLGQNALIATVPCESRYIHIALSVTKSIPSICISDSGTPFPTIVLEHLGIEKCSQHLDEGGSGIGLMDLWKLKSSSKATLLIKEDSSPEALYTKYIYLIFDTQGRYIIESDRITALHKHLSRTDVTLINE